MKFVTVCSYRTSTLICQNGARSKHSYLVCFNLFCSIVLTKLGLLFNFVLVLQPIKRNARTREERNMTPGLERPSICNRLSIFLWRNNICTAVVDVICMVTALVMQMCDKIVSLDSAALSSSIQLTSLYLALLITGGDRGAINIALAFLFTRRPIQQHSSSPIISVR